VRARTACSRCATLAPTGQTTASRRPAADRRHLHRHPDLPYYLTAPRRRKSRPAPLTGFWKAAPGAYVPPFAGLLDPTSTNITFANPFPVAGSTQKVPVLMTVPNAASGRTKPAPAGRW
jgi:hypothetical protein